MFGFPCLSALCFFHYQSYKCSKAGFKKAFVPASCRWQRWVLDSISSGCRRICLDPVLLVPPLPPCLAPRAHSTLGLWFSAYLMLIGGGFSLQNEWEHCMNGENKSGLFCSCSLLICFQAFLVQSAAMRCWTR